MTAPAAPVAGWTDLTRPVHTGMPVYPGDPGVRISAALRLDQDGVEVAHLDLGSHTGTHVDAPAHTVAHGRTVDRLRLDELAGRTLVLGFPELTAGAVVTAGMVENLLGARTSSAAAAPDGTVPPRVLIATGWDAHFEDAALRVHHPVLSAGAAELLWAAGARLLGVDTLSPDPTSAPGPTFAPDQPGAQSPPGFPVHRVFLGGDGMIVENLTALAGLWRLDTGGALDAAPGRAWTATVWCGIFPVPVLGGDGAPARAMAAAWPAHPVSGPTGGTP